MRFSSAASPAWNRSAPQPTGSPRKRRHHEHAGRRPHVVGLDGTCLRRVEAGVEAAVQLGEVRVEAVLGVAVAGIDGVDPDHRRREEPLHLPHRRDESVALGLRERVEQRSGQGVAAPVEQGALGPTGLGQLRGAHPLVVVAGADGDQPVGLQGAQEPAQVAGVEVEAGAQPPHVRPLTDLPQHARLAERAVTGQVLVVERADPLRDGAVEAPDPADGGIVHSLTLVREAAPSGGQPRRRCWPPSTVSRAPVTNRASSDARNSAA